MENLFYNISQVLGITIIHSLWQGLIIYVALRMLLKFTPNLSAPTKYKAALGALTLMVVWFAGTLYTEIDHYTWANTPNYDSLPVKGILPAIVQHWTAPTDRYYFVIAGYLPYITMLYIAGLVFNTLKMALAWNNIYRIRQNITEAGFQQQVNNFAVKMGIDRFVKVGFSEYITVPCITGFLKPLILLPLSISTYLTSEEIAAILLHELAHIKRNDYLLNLLQQAIGILLFFNPFSRLINKTIDRERENCCDDMVVATTGSPLIYAQALLKLEENKQLDQQLALAATGKKYHLLDRIERIMKTKNTTVNIRPALLALVLLTCSLSSVAWFNPKIENGKLSLKKITPNTLISEMLSDTVKKPKTAKAVVKVKPATKRKSIKIAGSDEEWTDAKLEKLAAEAEQHAQKLDKLFNGPEMKQLQDEMEKKGAEMEAAYNNPKLKQMEEQMEKKSAEFEKMNEKPEFKKMQDEIEAYSKKVDAYYNSPDFKKLQKNYEKKGELLNKAKPGTAEYKKQQAEFQEMAKSFRDYTNNPAIKEQTEMAKKMGEKMREYYKSPEYVKMRDALGAYGDSMRIAFQNPAMKEQQETMRKLGKAMRDQQTSPEILREKEELKKIEKEIRDYRMSPEYRKKIENMSGAIKEQVKKEIAEAREQAEKVEVKERRERPERPEVRERKELPAKPRTPDTARIQERKKEPALQETRVLPKKRLPVKAVENDVTQINIDAKTNVVKITTTPVDKTNGPTFNGVYVIQDKVYTTQELKKAIASTGKIDITLPNRPVIGYYSPNDDKAINKWGDQARNGVIFAIAGNNIKAPQGR